MRVEGERPHSLSISASSLVIQVAATLLRAAVTLHRSYNLQQLHLRHPCGFYDGYGRAGSPPSEPENDEYAKRPVSRLAKRLGIFPKTERYYTVRTERWGLLTAIGYAIMAIIMLAVFDRDRLEHIVVDTRYVCSVCYLFSP
jgi:hypothetical protein